MGQLILQLIPIAITGLLVFLACRFGAAMKHSGSSVSGEYSWMLPGTPALNEFIMFVLQSALAVSALVCTLLQVSNHTILSLDILYFFSLSMLILYHTIKEAGIPRVTASI